MTLMSLIRGKRSRGEGGNSLNENVRLQESAAPWKHDSHSVKDGKPNPTTSAHTILFLNVIWVLNMVPVLRLLRPASTSSQHYCDCLTQTSAVPSVITVSAVTSQPGSGER